MSNEEPAPIAREALERTLKAEAQEAADRIGDPGGYHRLGNYSDAEMAAYAEGVKTLLDRLGEFYEIDYGTHLTRQIDAALGERLRRTKSPNQKLKTRRLNNLVEEIRDKRIAMLDEYQGLDYRTEYEPMRKRMHKFERMGSTAVEWEDFQLVDRELRALFDLSAILISDKGWFARHYERRNKAKAVGYQEPEGGTMLLHEGVAA